MGNPVKRIERRSRRTLLTALLRARFRYGGKSEALIDADGRRMTYNEIVQAAFAIGSVLASQTKRGEKVGVLLPTGAGAMIAFFALQAFGRVPAMLNFTAGALNIKAACTAAEVTKIITANQFIELAQLGQLEDDLAKDFSFIYLEDVRAGIGGKDKAAAVLGPFVSWVSRIYTKSTDPGVILFTSGTEGLPKGVVLTHANVLANIEQINAHVTLEPNDIIFNPLPTFHCYGLTAGALWPVLTGRSIVLHPSPLQTKTIVQRVKETGATIILATDTFMQQYARASNDEDLKTLRIAVCGAEKVRDETRSIMEKRFGCEVLEGYGVTEAAPVLAANQPGDIRAGTVGRMLPAVEYKLEPVEGLEDGGRLFVRGPNIMAGYLSTDEPGIVKAPEDGWHDTGDVVSVDEDGCIAIRGRLKRFAKIGGEMVSLTVIENCASALWPEYNHAAVTLPDTRKGEQIILVTDCPKAERGRMMTWMQSVGTSKLAVPRDIVIVDEIPVLGTGKTDYSTVTDYAIDGTAAGAQPAEPEATGDSKEKKAETA